MKPFMLRNKRNEFPKKLEIGKNYWFGWRASSISMTFIFTKGKFITLIDDNDGEKYVVSKRCIRKLFGKDEWTVHFLVEYEEEK